MKCRHCEIEMDNPMIFHIHESRCLEDQKANGLIKDVINLEKDDSIDYSSMTVDQLKNLCKEKGFEGYSTLNKDDLVAFIKEKIKN